MPTLGVITLVAHVAVGTLAVVVGAVALGSRKGRKLHVSASRVFIVSMGLASLVGAVLGSLKYETFWITFHAGVLGTTRVTSSVLAVHIHKRGPKRWFIAVTALNDLNAASLFGAGRYAATLPDARLFGFATEDYLFLFGMAAIAFAVDMILTLGNQVSNRHPIAQHLIRMCFGFFIAAGSAFTGPGASAFPQAVQNSGVLSLPELTIVLLTLFWLRKTLRRPRPMLANQLASASFPQQRIRSANVPGRSIWPTPLSKWILAQLQPNGAWSVFLVVRNGSNNVKQQKSALTDRATAMATLGLCPDRAVSKGGFRLASSDIAALPQVSYEPTAEVFETRCVHSQHENRRECIIFSAAVQRDERPFALDPGRLRDQAAPARKTLSAGISIWSYWEDLSRP